MPCPLTEEKSWSATFALQSVRFSKTGCARFAAELLAAPRAHRLAELLDAHRRREILRGSRRLRALLRGKHGLRGDLRHRRPRQHLAAASAPGPGPHRFAQPPLDADRGGTLQRFAEQQPACSSMRDTGFAAIFNIDASGNLIKLREFPELGNLDPRDDRACSGLPISAPSCATTRRPAAEKSSSATATGT